MSQSPSGRRPRQPAGHPPSEPFPTPNEIAVYAHDLFVADGRRVTRIFEYWQRAEQELLDLAARRTLPRPARKR